jgi:uncharacterized protein YvpB
MRGFSFPRLLLLLLILPGLAACSGTAKTVEPAPTALPSATVIPATAAPTAVPTLPSTPTATQPVAPSHTVTPTPLPAEHYIRSISGHKQYFKLGCEAAVAKDWANYFGYDFNEFEFQYKLPLSDNPDYGFVGDVNSPWGQIPPYGYGVHAGPVADLLNTYGIPAKAYKNYTLDQVIAKVAADKPVFVWVIGNVVGGIPYEYTDKEGRKVTVAAYEHVVIVTGYNEKKLRYMTNGRFFETPKEVFLNSWGVLGNMVIVDQ